PRSTITKSDPTTLNDLRGFVGQRNLLPDAAARGAGEWGEGPGVAVGSGAEVTYRTNGWGATGRAVRITATATSNAFATSPAVDVVPGRRYLIHASVNPASTARDVKIRYQINNTGSSTPLDGTSEVVTAPSGADTMRVSVLLSSP